MQKQVFVFFFLLTTYFSFAQVIPRSHDGFNQGSFNQNDSIPKEQKINLLGKTTYKDYKIISYKNDTTYVDTTLTMRKDYKFNYIRKDNFELLPFHNQGQTFNRLAYSFNETRLFPSIGARAMHYNFNTVKDVDYYHVATPTTELMFRTGLEQGQVLDAWFTFNTSKRLNFSIAYKGLRSLGKYRTVLSSHGIFKTTFNYRTKNDRYTIRGHVVAQDLTNQENGGLQPISIINFENNDPNFTDRARLETNYNDAQNYLQGNRYYLENDFKIWQRKDSLNNTTNYLKVGALVNYQVKSREFIQTSANALHGAAFTSTIYDNVKNTALDAKVYLALKSPVILGELKFKANYYDLKNKYNSVTTIGNQQIPSTFNRNALGVGGEWKTKLKKFNIEADASLLVGGNITANYLKASASFKQDSLFFFKGTFLSNTKSPNINFLYNQSNYTAYNWNINFDNETIRSLIFDLKSDKLLNASAQITQVDNYTYFSDTTGVAQNQPRPMQFSGTINYLKIKASKEFRFGKFGLNNTIMYQTVTNGSSVFRVPDFVTRNTLFFADHLFKGDPLYLQTGITLKYFTKFYANAYNPVLAEFNLQDDQQIGGYPVLDFFVNAQIQRTRIFFKIEHFNSNFGNTNNHYAAPTYPYRDFVIRFGLVWNFFI